jgi:peroxiredoxin
MKSLNDVALNNFCKNMIDQDAKKNKAIVLFYFDPNCDHCQHQTEDIIANKDILKKVNFYFISLDSFRRIKKFKDYYHLQDLSEITVAKDYEYNVFKTFKIESIPTNIVYNSNHKIVKIYPGGMSVSQLKNVLNL